MSKFSKLGIQTVALSLISGFFLPSEISPAEASQADGTLSELRLEGTQLLDITREITFTAVLRCESGPTPDPEGPMGTLVLGTVDAYLSVDTPAVLRPDSDEYLLTWLIEPEQSLVLRHASQIPVSAVSLGCASDATLITETLFFDGPRTLILPNPVARKWMDLYQPLEFTVYTFQNNQMLEREASDLFSVPPVCGFKSYDEGIGDYRVFSVDEYDELMDGIDYGRHPTLCEGGTLKPEEQWRKNSLEMEQGTMAYLGDWQIPLAPNHLMDLLGNKDFETAEISQIIPAGSEDAAYVFSKYTGYHGNVDWWEREFSLGALVNTSVTDGRSLSSPECSSNTFSAITSSATERLVVATGITGQSLEPELLKMTFADNSVNCVKADLPVSDDWDYFNDFISSIALLDSRSVVTLSSGSLISRFDIDEPGDGGSWNEWDRYTVPTSPNLRKIVGDGLGGLWGVSQTDTEVRVWEINIPFTRIIRASDPAPEFTFSSFSTFQDDDSPEDDNGEEFFDDEGPTYQSVSPRLVRSFDLDADLGEELVDFQLRGDILTVTTNINAEPYWGTNFTRLWSFDKSRSDENGLYAVAASMNSILPEIIDAPYPENIRCTEQLYGGPDPEPLAFCFLSLLGVDAANGVAVLSAARSFIVRSGRVQPGQTAEFFDAEHDELIGGGGVQGKLSNSSTGAWLFDTWDATFERVRLTAISSPPTNETPSDPNVEPPLEENPAPPTQDPIPPPTEHPAPPSQDSPGPSQDPVNPPSEQPVIQVSTPGPELRVGPTFSGPPVSGHLGSEVVLTGQRLATISSLKIGEVTQTLTSKTDTELRFKIDANTKLGVNDIVLVSSFGTMTLQSHVTILGSRDRGPLTNSVTNPLIGTTKMLSRSSVNNQRWFKANLEDSVVGRILCTALVRANATEQQKRRARTLAQTTCSQAAEFLDAPKVSIRVRETTTAKMSGRVMIGFREAPASRS